MRPEAAAEERVAEDPRPPEAEPDLLAAVLVDLLAEDAALEEPPRAELEAPFERDDFDAVLEPPRVAALEEPLRDFDAALLPPRVVDFDAPPRADFDAPFEREDLEAAFLVREDLDAPPREDLVAPFEDLLRLDDLEADLDLPPDFEADFLLLDADFDPLEDPPLELFDAPPRLEDFLEALFLDLPPELLLADFLDAAFLVDFAMLMGFLSEGFDEICFEITTVANELQKL